MYFKLYVVESPIGNFIGVAVSMEAAVEHWGTRSKIREVRSQQEILDLRTSGPERVFLAI